MKSPEKGNKRIDPARLAALIDGRLPEGERLSLMQQLTSSDDALDVMGDAIGAAAHLSSTESLQAPSPSVVPLAAGRRVSSSAILGLSLAAAAVLTIVVAVPRSKSGSTHYPTQMVQALTGDLPLPGDWNYSPWSNARGGDVLTEQTAYLRLGARVVDLKVAAGSRDTAMLRSLAADVNSLLAAIPGGGAVAAYYRTLAATGDQRQLTEGASALRELPNQQVLEKGAWLETARIAAARHDLTWFNRNIDNAILRQSIGESERSAFSDIERSVRNGPPDWDALSRFFENQLSAY